MSKETAYRVYQKSEVGLKVFPDPSRYWDDHTIYKKKNKRFFLEISNGCHLNERSLTTVKLLRPPSL